MRQLLGLNQNRVGGNKKLLQLRAAKQQGGNSPFFARRDWLWVELVLLGMIAVGIAIGRRVAH